MFAVRRLPEWVVHLVADDGDAPIASAGWLGRHR